MSSTPKAALHTLGCRLNQSETAIIGKSLQAEGYELVSTKEPADVCVINTCTVTHSSDAKGRQFIRSVHRQNPDCDIVVVGCYAQMAADTIKNLPGVKLVIGTQDKLEVANFLKQAQQSEEPLVIQSKMDKKPFQVPSFSLEHQTTRAHLKIQDGCDFMCTFCIIPFSRGRSRCRDFDDILKEANQLVAQGTKEIVLSGVNLGCYENGPYDLVSVVDALDAINGLERVRISSIEPTTVDSGILERMAKPQHKLVPFLHLPLQSGSTDILAAMKRRYDAQAYFQEAQTACKQIPNLCLGTDVMTGFPGETDEQFDETYRLLEELPFAYFHVFPFSARKGTPAIRMPNPVSPQVQQYRSQQLRQLSDIKQQQFYQQFVGTERTVLFEAPKSQELAEGYTDNYLRVSVPHPNPQQLRNQLHLVEITHMDNQALIGKLR